MKRKHAKNHFKSPSSKVSKSYYNYNNICIFLNLVLTHTQNQTETSLSATKKKCSKSGGEKNESGDLRKEQLERTLGFFGAGGHVEISGILNF